METQFVISDLQVRRLEKMLDSLKTKDLFHHLQFLVNNEKGSTTEISRHVYNKLTHNSWGGKIKNQDTIRGSVNRTLEPFIEMGFIDYTPGMGKQKVSIYKLLSPGSIFIQNLVQVVTHHESNFRGKDRNLSTQIKFNGKSVTQFIDLCNFKNVLQTVFTERKHEIDEFKVFAKGQIISLDYVMGEADDITISKKMTEEGDRIWSEIKRLMSISIYQAAINYKSLQNINDTHEIRIDETVNEMIRQLSNLVDPKWSVVRR